MFAMENIEIHFSGSIFLFVIAFIVLVLFTIYNYKITIPYISRNYKIFLITIRSLALILILFLIFEPILTFTNKKIISPLNLVFVDNSKSMSVNRDKNDIKSLIDNFNNKSDYKIFTFGSKINEIDNDSLSKLNYDEASTNFENIFKYVSDLNSDIASLTIISDGNITDGISPINETDKINFPIYTVGMGDTTINKDVLISKVNFNKYIYANTSTTLSIVLNNVLLADKSVYVTLFEDGNQIERKNVSLSKDGINNLNFEYLPKEFGEKKLKITIDNVEGEDNFVNNTKTFFINVLKSKLKILIIAGSPSNDLSILRTTLNSNKDYSVKSLTYITNNNFLEKENTKNLLDSADIFLLVGFPSNSASTDFISRLKTKIDTEKKPFLFLLANDIDSEKINLLSDVLPFIIKSPTNQSDEVMPSIVKEELTNPILQISDGDILKSWNNLPPVYQSRSQFTAKPGAKILSDIIINNILIRKPLIVANNIAGKRSISILASSIWRWRLIGDKTDDKPFDRFIFNCIKWLNSNDKDKRIIIKPVKKLFALNEDVEFTAQIYDESFNPISNADVSVFVKQVKSNTTTNLNFSSKGNGLYEGVLQTNLPGDYTFTGNALLNGKLLGTDSGKFNVGEIDQELNNTKLNYDLLKNISSNSNGKYFTFSNTDKLIQLLNEKNKNNKTEKLIKSEISLWSNEWLLIIIVLLFSIEWFLRKRLNML